MWECGLKLKRNAISPHTCKVTPYVGVWIETLEEAKAYARNAVTPYVGVWIETGCSSDYNHRP